MKDSLTGKKEMTMTCQCGHPEGEHSQCTGECYLCACKHYVPTKIGAKESALLARAYRYIVTWVKSATGTDRASTRGKCTIWLIFSL
jgi:hypothetical protein